MRRIIEAIESYLGRFLLWVACVMLVAVVATRTDSPTAWSAEDWQAVGSVVTAGIAVLAIAVAVGQLGESRDLRWEQAMPYLVAFLEPEPTDPSMVYLVFKNFGATAAIDVKIKVVPDPQRSTKFKTGAALTLPTHLSSLVPGQEWKLLWDHSPTRFGERALMPQEHRVEIQFTDSRGRRVSAESGINWNPYLDARNWLDRKSIHHVGIEMQAIRKGMGFTR